MSLVSWIMQHTAEYVWLDTILLYLLNSSQSFIEMERDLGQWIDSVAGSSGGHEEDEFFGSIRVQGRRPINLQTLHQGETEAKGGVQIQRQFNRVYI